VEHHQNGAVGATSGDELPPTVESVFGALDRGQLTPYEAIDRLMGLRPAPGEALQEIVGSVGRSAYVRLCAAWALGALGVIAEPEQLLRAYRDEQEDNVRANIAWAIARCCPHVVTPHVYGQMLADRSYHVALVALRYFSGRSELRKQLQFDAVYAGAANELVRLELLRAISGFIVSEQASRHLVEELFHETEPLLFGVMEALALTGQTEALLRYYAIHRDQFAANAILAMQFARCCVLLCESEPQPQLNELYWQHTEATVRWTIIEALAAGGGPRGKAALRRILERESDPSLQAIATRVHSLVQVTEPSRTTPAGQATGTHENLDRGTAAVIIHNGVPASQRQTIVQAGGRAIVGVVSDPEDLIDPRTGLPILYRGWPPAHFASDWYGIFAAEITTPEGTARDASSVLAFAGALTGPIDLIIDLNAGSGRHVEELGRRGVRCIGMEEIPEMRANAPAGIEMLDLTEQTRAQHAGRADVVTSLFNALGYTFDRRDDVQRLRWAAGLLRPGGLLVTDIRNEAHQRLAYQHPTEEVQTIATPIDATLWTRRYWAHGILAAERKVTLPGDNNRVVHHSTFGWRTYNRPELSALLTDAGLTLTGTQEHTYTAQGTPGERLWIIAEKPTT
jgi:hypothetical protein